MITPQDILGPEGRIAARLPGYEHRQQQLDMADAVHDALARGEHLIVEAGTGVGKSFAYLVPAILAATDDNDDVRRVIVSTHTISLQEQLLGKDLPLLNSVIPREFSAVLAKGRGNYLSLRRMQHAAKRAVTLFGEDQEHRELGEITHWSQQTADGSLSDLSFRPLGSVWDEVQSDSGNCMGRKCPTHSKCFYYRARRRLQNAQILVVNHALFFSDLALRAHDVSILPDYQAVILDEAHTVESVASDHLGISVTSGQIRYLLNKLYNDRMNKGVLAQPRFEQGQRLVLQCHRAADEFFDDAYQWAQEGSNHTVRMMRPKLLPESLGSDLLTLSSWVGRVADDEEDEDVRLDLRSHSDRLRVLSGSLQLWVQQEENDQVYWLEGSLRRSGEPRVKLSAAPVDIGPALRKTLFESTRSVVLASATLATGDPPSFEFFKSRIGLTHSEQTRLGSPFNYQDQVELVVVRGLPDPSNQREAFEKQCIELLPKYIESTRGHAFCLFTSYGMLRRAQTALTPWLARHNLALYSQADGTPRSQLLDRFRQNPEGVLLGTASFWQGVDVPGAALQNVIITKLPFSVPDHPLTQAKLDLIREQGGSPFFDYQLPEAVIKLRQGFGRLIRTQEDFGRVVILDPRVLTKSYGRSFLESLPTPYWTEHEVGNSEY